MFFSLNLLHPKGNHPSKFQLLRFSHFGGVSLTHWYLLLFYDVYDIELNDMYLEYERRTDCVIDEDLPHEII